MCPANKRNKHFSGNDISRYVSWSFQTRKHLLEKEILSGEIYKHLCSKHVQDHDDMLLQQYLLLCRFFEKAYKRHCSLVTPRQAGQACKLSFLSTGLDNKDLEATSYTHLLPVTRMQKLNVILGLCTAITASLIPGHHSGASVSTKVAGAAPVKNLYSFALSSRSVQ